MDTGYPSESTEGVGHIVGISDHCGHALTWQILTSDTNCIIFRSLVRPYHDNDPNLRADLLGGETFHNVTNPIIKSRHDNDIIIESNPISTSNGETNGEQEPQLSPPPPPIINPEELIGKTFLMDEQEDGQRFRAKITKLVQDHDDKIANNPNMVKFILSVNNDMSEEIKTYNQLLQYLNKDEENDILWKFRHIVSHQGPLSNNHKDYNGCPYNIMVEWENGEITKEPLNHIARDDPVTCAIYAREKGLLDKPGWKRFKAIAKREKKFLRMVNQAKLRSFNTSPKYKYGFEVPRTYDQAIRIDEKNGNTLWGDAVILELKQIDEYDTFIDKGHHTKINSPSEYNKIRVHLIFDVKHDGRHKARLVADGHLTDVPLESVYSGVVSLRGYRIVLFLAERNQLELWSTAIGNAYLEAFTSEKVFIIAGPEFGN